MNAVYEALVKKAADKKRVTKVASAQRTLQLEKAASIAINHVLEKCAIAGINIERALMDSPALRQALMASGAGVAGAGLGAGTSLLTGGDVGTGAAIGAAGGAGAYGASKGLANLLLRSKAIQTGMKGNMGPAGALVEGAEALPLSLTQRALGGIGRGAKAVEDFDPIRGNIIRREQHAQLSGQKATRKAKRDARRDASDLDSAGSAHEPTDMESIEESTKQREVSAAFRTLGL